MTGKRAILSDVMAARDEARANLPLLPIESHQRFYDLEAKLETLQHMLAVRIGANTEPLLREAQGLARELLLLVRHRAA